MIIIFSIKFPSKFGNEIYLFNRAIAVESKRENSHKKLDKPRNDGGLTSQVEGGPLVPVIAGIGPTCSPETRPDQTCSEGRTILKSSEEENVCMFYALFNALRPHNLHIAFAAGADPPTYCSKFLEHMRKDKHVSWMRVMKEGFNAEDMRHYLEWLKDSQFITSYVWKSLTDRWSVSTVLSVKDGKPHIYLISAAATKSDQRSVIEKRLKSS